MKDRWILALSLGSISALSCGGEEEVTENAAVTCCTCLVNAGCVKADEYEFCKDTLEGGGSLQVRGLRTLTCDDSACIDSKQCSSPGASDGSGSADSSGDDANNGEDARSGSEDVPGESGAYVLVVESAEYDGSDLDGADWDVLDQPDPFVSVRINGESIGTTSIVVDSYYPEWTDEFYFDAPAGTELSFRFFDSDDVSGDDYGGEFVVQDLQSAIISGGRSETTVGTAVVSVTYSIRER